MKGSGAPSIGDIVEVAYSNPRRGLVVGERGKAVGILYFKPSAVKGMAADFVWWIDRCHVRIISPSGKTEKV